jgi:SAM-dependent methyltransferase
VRVNDPADVSAQYATEANLEARRSIYANAEGPDAREVTFEAAAEIAPARVLEVGGGPGELAARIADELDAAVVMIDLSPRMVELARRRGVDARVGDVQALPFDDGEFDCVVAAWMLFHVPDLGCGLAEIARVLRPGGRLVATTNGEAHLRELRQIAGRAAWARVFTRENGAEILGRHFARVERRDADGWITIEDAETVRAWVASLDGDASVELPPFELPLRARQASSVFVAEK